MLCRLKKIAVSLVVFLIILGFTPSSVLAQSGIDLILNYIESQPKEGQYAYDVTATFSLLDSAGNPIKDLDISGLTLSEDGQAVLPDSLEVVTDQPIYISLLLDTSGSMTGSKIEAARAAAIQFVNGLKADDRLALTTFNDDILQLSDFSTDHASTKNLIASINAKDNGGTCLYDAAYEAVQKIAALPYGRRAVILLTDGKDETLAGGPCSKLTIDDVIGLASEGNIRVPIFTIALGNNVDEAGLTRLATLTGGRFDKSQDTSQLEGLFARLLDLLQSQYILHYTSSAAPGSHSLVMNVDYLNESATDTRGYILPALPLNLTIVSPTSGQEVTNKIKIVTAITGQGQPIKNVVFSVNDTAIGTAEVAPYELEWMPDASFNGDAVLTATALGTDGSELAKGSVNIVVNMEGGAVDTTPGTDGDDDDKDISEFFTTKNIIIYGSILLVVVVCVVLFFVLTAKKRKEEKRRDKQWNDVVVNPPNKGGSMNEMTMDGFVLGDNALGGLMVLQSDDPAMLGQRFEITEQTTRLGRAADNDVLFPKDGPVSRHHAIIENRNGQLILSELISDSGDGTAKSPTFGTFVNDQKVIQPVALRNGDLIRLGKRVVLKFESASHDEGDDDARTVDQINVDDMDRTIDS